MRGSRFRQCVFGVLRAQTFQVIHDFTGGPDGANPYSGLTIDSSGNLYGIASAGGGGTCVLNNTPGCGTVFEMTQSSGSWSLQGPQHFVSNPDGAAPIDNVILGANGSLFGTNAAGGEGNCNFEGDVESGTVFQLLPTQSHDRVLYRFTGGTDGGQPTADVLLLNNILYGTTLRGGDYPAPKAMAMAVALCTRCHSPVRKGLFTPSLAPAAMA